MLSEGGRVSCASEEGYEKGFEGVLYGWLGMECEGVLWDEMCCEAMV